MSDRLVRGLLPGAGLRVVFVRVADTARMGRMLHGLYPTAAHLFAEGLAGALLVAALQKEDRSRVNLQIECDGPIRGLFVDADPDGNVRGYVRRPEVHFPGDPQRAATAALGASGFLSVLRDMGSGQWYRAHLQLEERTLVGDLSRYFAESEQVDTALDLAVVHREGEPLGDVAGLLFQKLPDGDGAALERLRERLRAGALREALAASPTPQDVIAAVAGPGFELLADLEIAYRCGCSQERARNAVSAMGRAGIEEILADEREAVITCEFCRQRYVVSEAELRDMAQRLAARDG